MVQTGQADGREERGWEERDPASGTRWAKTREGPCASKALLRPSPPLAMGLGKAFRRLQSVIGREATGPFLGLEPESGGHL